MRFGASVLKTTAALELTGALVLTLWWWNEHGLARAAWLGLFHAVSAFNNAGFSLFSDNLVRYRGDLVVNARDHGVDHRWRHRLLRAARDSRRA